MKRLLKPCLLIMLFAILPLYMRQGYYELGEAKGLFFMIVGGILALLLVIFDYKLFLDFWAEQSNICYSVIVLCFSAVSSLLLSIVKDTSFFGLRGWRTGFITFFICFVLFVEFRGERNIGGKTIAFLLVVPFIEFILGIIMRFGIYPIKFYGLDNAVLDTQVVEEGNAATAPEVPEIVDNANGTWIFCGWDVAFDNITADTEVHAIYWLLGDTDLNGTVTANDALLALRGSMGLVTLSETQVKVSDVDFNGSVSGNDALKILRYTLGLITSLVG